MIWLIDKSCFCLDRTVASVVPTSEFDSPTVPRKKSSIKVVKISPTWNVRGWHVNLSMASSQIIAPLGLNKKSRCKGFLRRCPARTVETIEGPRKRELRSRNFIYSSFFPTQCCSPPSRKLGLRISRHASCDKQKRLRRSDNFQTPDQITRRNRRRRSSR